MSVWPGACTCSYASGLLELAIVAAVGAAAGVLAGGPPAAAVVVGLAFELEVGTAALLGAAALVALELVALVVVVGAAVPSGEAGLADEGDWGAADVDSVGEDMVGHGERGRGGERERGGRREREGEHVWTATTTSL